MTRGQFIKITQICREKGVKYDVEKDTPEAFIGRYTVYMHALPMPVHPFRSYNCNLGNCYTKDEGSVI